MVIGHPVLPESHQVVVSKIFAPGGLQWSLRLDRGRIGGGRKANDREGDHRKERQKEGRDEKWTDFMGH